jgi:hypothetical protein
MNIDVVEEEANLEKTIFVGGLSKLIPNWSLYQREAN